MNFFAAVLKTLFKKKSSFVFPVISVAVSVMSVIIISTASKVGTQKVSKEINTLGVGNILISAQGEDYLKKGELEKIRDCSVVSSASPMLYFSTSLESYKGIEECILWGIDNYTDKTMNLNIKYGTNISQQDVFMQNNVCLVDVSYAKKLYGRENIVGKKISVMLSNGYEEFKIIGVTDDKQSLVKNMISGFIPTLVYVPYSVMREGNGEDFFSSIAVMLNKNVSSEFAETAIKRGLFEYSGVENNYSVENMMKHTQTVNNILKIVTTILSAIAGVSLLISGISVMTVMMFSVGERTREIGIKKAIGASFFDILFEFLTQAVVISLIGCLFGLLLGVSLAYIGCRAFSFDVVFDVNMIVICVAVTTAFGLVFGIYPAICAARLEPAVALRRK